MRYYLLTMKVMPHQINVLRSDRIRKPISSFAFIEHRFLRDGFFESLNCFEQVLYFFLIVVSDRNGVSWYSCDRICSITGFTLEQYIEARNSLVSKDLIDFNGRIFQVLSLPEKPVIKNDNNPQEILNVNALIQNMFRRIP